MSIDEQMVAYKGRLSFKQYMPAKPIKWGMKAYVLAEADTGYVCDWHLYTGKDDSDLQSADTAKRTQVVMRLIRNLQPGHIIYIDNYYTSPDLFTTLRLQETWSSGHSQIQQSRLTCTDEEKDEKDRSNTALAARFTARSRLVPQETSEHAIDNPRSGNARHSHSGPAQRRRTQTRKEAEVCRQLQQQHGRRG